VTYGLGVDIGTTFVAAAIARPTGPEMVTLGDRALVSPAVVYLREDGSMITGDAADRRAVSNPDRVGREFKRRLGDPTPVILGGVSCAVPDLLGALLNDVLEKVAESEGGPPAQVVLTYPANWGPYRRELFDEVALASRLTGPQMITEPEAAAAHYVTSARLDDGEMVAVYDLGGGTFDATILRKRDGGLEILGTPEGIERLGGVDFDEAILAYVNYTAGGALSELDMSDPTIVVALARLRQDCVLAKEALSVDTETVIPVFLPGRHFEVPLTRAGFEEMVRAPIESTVGALARTLRSAQVDATDLSAVLLVGGSSRIPLVARMVMQDLGRPVVVDTHPKYGVALGAASVAATALQHPAPVNRTPTATVPAPTRPVDDETTVHIPHPVAPAVAMAAASGVRSAPQPEAPAPLHPAIPMPSPPSPAGPAYANPAPGGNRAGQPHPLLRLPAPPVPSPVAAGPAPAGPPPRRGRRLPLLAAAVVVVLVVGAAAVLVPTWASAKDPAALTPPPAVTAVEPRITLPTAHAVSIDQPTVTGLITVAAAPEAGAVTHDGKFAYVTSTSTNSISVIDIASDAVVASIAIPAGPPQFVIFTPDDKRAYVSIYDKGAQTGNSVIAVDTASRQVIASVPAEKFPYAIAISPNGKQVYVPNHDANLVSVIDTATNTIVNKIAVKPNPHSVAFSNDGRRVYVADHASNIVTVLDAGTGATVAEIPVGRSPHSISMSPDGAHLYVVDYDGDDITVINPITNTVLGAIPVQKKPQSVAFSGDSRHAYVVNDESNTVSVIDTVKGAVTATVGVGTSPTNVFVAPDGKHAYVTNIDSNDVSVMSIAG